jgi:glutamate dehydrogenase (NAD(P)+)
MALMKLESTDAFVVRDFDDDVPALGIVRSAPKILQSGAKELARSQTYQCAVFNMKCQGASAGINAAPDARDAAIAAFCEELLPLASSGALMLDPGKGVDGAGLDALFAADPRGDAAHTTIDGLPNVQHLTGLGAVACAEAVGALDGKKIAIDNYEVNGPAVARAAAERGAVVTAVGTSGGAVMNADGFDVAGLNEAWDAHGARMLAEVADEVLAANRLLGADVDVLFAGSKMGLINHNGAPYVKAGLVVPTGPIPYTTKGALMLEAAGTTVLPDIVATAGGMFASMPPTGEGQAAIEASVIDLLGTLTGQIIGQDRMPILEACHRAESFLETWRDELPFGRPFAA